MLVYIAFICCICCCWFLDEKIPVRLKIETGLKQRRSVTILFMVAFIISCLFLGLRYDVGWDYMAYYDTITDHLSTNIVNNGEILNVLLIDISRWLNQAGIYFFLNAVIQLYCVFYIINKYSLHKWLSVLIYLCFPLFYLNTFSVIRFATALAISFLSFDYIVKKQPLKFIFSILIACMFHKTAFVCLAFYVLYRVTLNYKTICMLLICGGVGWKALIFLVSKYSPGYLVYLGSTSNQEGKVWLIIFWLILIAAIAVKYYCKNSNKLFDLESNIFLLSVFIYTILFQYGTIGHRLSLYGTIYAILLVPQIIKNFQWKERTILIQIIKYGFIVIFLIYVFLGRSTYLPYKTILSII